MRNYYHYCVDVLMWDEDKGAYVLWFVQSFSSKMNYEIWRDGFMHGLDQRVMPFRVKLGETYVKYRSYKPKL